MPRKPRAWGNNAAAARDSAAEDLVAIVLILKPLLEERAFTTSEVLRRTGLAIAKAQHGCMTLKEQGAPIRADAIEIGD